MDIGNRTIEILQRFPIEYVEMPTLHLQSGSQMHDFQDITTFQSIISPTRL